MIQVFIEFVSGLVVMRPTCTQAFETATGAGDHVAPLRCQKRLEFGRCSED
jgi:hypothetical protein